MMKKSTFLFVVILLVGFGASCRKEQDRTIALGETTGMMVTVYDSTYIGLGETMKLDIDGDGEDDLKIRSYYDGPHMESTQILTLHCLNDEIALRCEMKKKESYQHFDTIVEEYAGILGVLYLSVYNSCEPMGENDVIQNVNALMPSASDAGDLVSVDDFFQSKVITLFREDIQEARLDHVSNDTSYFYRSVYLYQCDNFPTNAEKYIGIKLTKDGMTRLGWLKINLIGASVVYPQLIEIAIQK
ncbi:MAG: hypothetical protein IJL04_02585 [Bacteroidales bacterium]|nr:hypothetical protein [Bacteroidales bacterium]MBQ6101162.1 hypothetical protein [Bacteroidales bacterium]